MPTQLPVWVWPAALLGVCAIAAVRGRDNERLAAAGYLAAWALSLVVFRAHSEDMQWALAAIDTCLFGLVLYIALVSHRYWPLVVAAMQLLAVVTYLARSLDSAISGWAYLTAVLVWNYLALFVIGYAAWTAPKRYAEIEALDARDVPGATRR